MFDFERFEKDSHQVERDKYTSCYPYLVYFFEKKLHLTIEDFICGVHMVYAWMPTILRLYITDLKKVDCEKLDQVVHLINLAKKKGTLYKDEINYLAKIINNSVVGTSKLLHFIAPESFSIWDSRVYRYLYNQKPHNYRLNDVSEYLKYIDIIKKIIKHDSFRSIHIRINKKMEYSVTAMRAVELIMFQNNKKI